jgi:predicted AlkP superfamily phosphohydrolase/phosphomutase
VALTERLRRLVPAEVRERLAMRLLPGRVQHALASRAFRDRYDWAATAVFPLPTWTAGYLRVNLAGREAAGIVAPERYRDVIAEVVTLLAETVDAETGRPLAREVLVTPDAFPGTRSAELPDIVVVWGPDRPVRRARHPRLGEWSAEPRVRLWRWGEHRSGGRVVLAGPGVRPGTAGHGDACDLAPTLLTLAGCRPPSTLRGEVWRDVLA